MQGPCAILSSLACPAVPHFCTPHYLLKDTIFGKKKELNVMCFDFFCSKFVSNIFHSKKNLALYTHKIFVGLHVKYPLFLEAWGSVVVKVLRY